MPFERKREGQAIQATQNPLFRTIDGASQATIAMKYVAPGQACLTDRRRRGFRRLRFSFFKRILNHWFALVLRSRAVCTFGAALRAARRTTGDGLSSCRGA
jgi:hypothetical protein